MWWKKWDCYGQDPEVYLSSYREIRRANDKSIRIISRLGLFFMTLLSVLSFVESYGESYRIMYVSGMILLGLFCVGYSVLSKQGSYLQAWIYLLLTIVFGLGIFLSVQVPKEKSVVFFVLMVVLPVLFIDYAFRMTLFLCIVAAAFIFAVCQVKTGSVLHSDIYNGISLGIMAIVMHALVTAKIAGSCVNQHQKEFALAELKEMQRELNIKVRTDQMTGLLNRNAFMDLVASLMKRSEILIDASLLILDLNKFKSINDTYGHQTGDMVIVNVAKKIQESVRNNDFAGRLGGDEFIVLLVDVESRKNVEALVNRLLNNISSVGYGDDLYASASVGVAFVHKEDALEDVYSRADEALYETKRGGRKGFTFYEDLKGTK